MILPFVEMLGQNTLANSCNLPKPKKFKVSNIKHNQATLTWESDPNAKGYIIYLYDRKDSLLSTTTVDKQPTTFMLQNLQPNKNYKVCIAARCKVGTQVINSPNATCRVFKTDIIIISDVVMKPAPVDDTNRVDLDNNQFDWNVSAKYLLVLEEISAKYYLLLEKTNGNITVSTNLQINRSGSISTHNFPLSSLNVDGSRLEINDPNLTQRLADVTFDSSGFFLNSYNCSNIELYRVP